MQKMKLDPKGFEINLTTFVVGYHDYASILYEHGTPPRKIVTIKYSTEPTRYEDLSAIAGLDYKETKGSFKITIGGALSKEIRVPILSSTADFSQRFSKDFLVKFAEDVHRTSYQRITLTNFLRTPISNSLPAGVTGLFL
ncbi:MAG: hypothetical protein ACKO5F_04000, partial [Synechococcus sp.]